MSLGKKYTWADFLRSHPEHKQKKIKRTSKEGQKAFETAYKQHIKDFLKERLVRIEKEQEQAAEKRKELSKSLKATKNADTAKRLKERLSAAEAYIARLDRIQGRTKTLQKNV